MKVIIEQIAEAIFKVTEVSDGPGFCGCLVGCVMLPILGLVGIAFLLGGFQIARNIYFPDKNKGNKNVTVPSPSPTSQTKTRIQPGRVIPPPPPPPPPSPTPTPRPTTTPLRQSGGVLQGNAIKKPAPIYPQIARAAGVSGPVQVRVLISEDGRVIEAEVVNGHQLLHDAALQAARQWVFRPTELSGVPMKVEGILTFNFTLQ